MAQGGSTDRLFLTDLAMEVDVAGEGLGTPGRLPAVALSALEGCGNGLTLRGRPVAFRSQTGRPGGLLTRVRF